MNVPTGEGYKGSSPFCAEYFRGIEHTSILTRINYGYDLRLFFNFLTGEIDEFLNKKVQDLTIDDLEKVKAVHLEMFLEHISLYNRSKDGSTVSNQESGKARKLSAIRSCFSHFYKRLFEEKHNRTGGHSKVQKAIIRLDVDEVARLLDSVENGDGLTDTQEIP